MQCIVWCSMFNGLKFTHIHGGIYAQIDLCRQYFSFSFIFSSIQFVLRLAAANLTGFRSFQYQFSIMYARTNFNNIHHFPLPPSLSLSRSLGTLRRYIYIDDALCAVWANTHVRCECVYNNDDENSDNLSWCQRLKRDDREREREGEIAHTHEHDANI